MHIKVIREEKTSKVIRIGLQEFFLTDVLYQGILSMFISQKQKKLITSEQTGITVHAFTTPS